MDLRVPWRLRGEAALPGPAVARPNSTDVKSDSPGRTAFGSTPDLGQDNLTLASDCVTLRPMPRDCQKLNQNREHLVDRRVWCFSPEFVRP